MNIYSNQDKFAALSNNLQEFFPEYLRRDGKYRVVTVFVEKRDGENIPHCPRPKNDHRIYLSIF